jgi:hypothetical protein
MNASLTPFPFVDLSVATDAKPSRAWVPFPMLMNTTASMPHITPRSVLPPLPAFWQPGNSVDGDLFAMPDSLASVPREQRMDSPFVPRTESMAPAMEPHSAETDYTDQDLAAALSPLLEDSLQQVLNRPNSLMETHWEPWLRMTMRRALAEHRSLGEPIAEAGWLARLCWRFSAHVSGREYDEYLSEKHQQFRVEQVFLLSREEGHLLAHTCLDESRWGNSTAVLAQAGQLAEMMRDADGTLRLQFHLAEGRRAELRVGRAACLIVITTGIFPDSLHADLDFALRRIEERFGSRFSDRNAALAAKIKPMLTDCLYMADPVQGD